MNPREINLRSIEYKDDIAEDNHGGESDEVFVMENLNSALLRDPRRGKDLRRRANGLSREEIQEEIGKEVTGVDDLMQRSIEG